METNSTEGSAQQRARAALSALTIPPRNAEEEGSQLEAAYHALVACQEDGYDPAPQLTAYVFQRLLAHDRLAAMQQYLHLDDWRIARAGQLPGVHMQVPLSRVGRTDAARRDFLAQRVAWGAAVEADVQHRRSSQGFRLDGPVRLGFVSNDLRHTIVGAFAWPLFEHRQADVEVFVYTTAAPQPDPIQRYFERWSTAYRFLPGASAEAVAESVRADGVDMLIDMGSPFAWEVAALRPAPVLASWMGYPAPVGLPSIRNVILDERRAPASADLLLEEPLLLRGSWIAMSPGYFEEQPRPDVVPEERNGVVTFGTLSATYKITGECLHTWARVLAQTPGSRFLVVRPECAAPTFRRNLLAAFALHGVETHRVEFRAIRGGHLQHYNDIDIALDTFPVTGGTTTCEALWMGVPMVSLAGPTAYERVSASILENAGLGDLVAEEPEGFVVGALELAADRRRRERLKHGLRDQIRSRPLGQPESFASDFYELVVRTVERRRRAPAHGANKL